MSHPVDLDGLDGRDAEIARAVAPILLLDRHEPFRPVAAGVSIFAEPTQSPSCKHRIAPLGERCVEYAIFWDHDIGHTYDLEHIWVHLSADDVPIAIEASQHGRKISVGLELRGNRPVLWVEAGKHAHFSSRRERHAQAEATRAMCGLGAGKAGVHLGISNHCIT